MSEKSSYYKQIFDTLDKACIKYEIKQGGKHKSIEWKGRDGTIRKFFLKRSKPGDIRTYKNAISDIKKILRKDNII